MWNDPINLMSYVTFVLQKLFGYSLEKATKLMMDVHTKGKAVVSSGERERAELDVFRLHEHGLWATMEKDVVALVPRRPADPSGQDGDGFDVRLPDAERELLASLPGELVELLDRRPGPDALAEDPALARLFPDAYTAADADFDDEYRRLMTDDLRDRHRASLETMAAGGPAPSASTPTSCTRWMTALGQLRLVIGTRLGVTEDMRAASDEITRGVSVRAVRLPQLAAGTGG